MEEEQWETNDVDGGWGLWLPVTGRDRTKRKGEGS